jgi:hypothetical protein
MPDRSKVMTQTKRDILLLQAGGCGEAKNLTSVKKNLIVDQPHNGCQLVHSGEMAKKIYKDYDFYIPAWNVLSL